MSEHRDLFRYRDRFISAISRGPKKVIKDAGLLRCHACGCEVNIVITPYVAARHPPNEIEPRNSLDWQALLDGWVIANTQIMTGVGITDWDMALCPDCVDKHLEQAQRVMSK